MSLGEVKTSDLAVLCFLIMISVIIFRYDCLTIYETIVINEVYSQDIVLKSRLSCLIIFFLLATISTFVQFADSYGYVYISI